MDLANTDLAPWRSKIRLRHETKVEMIYLPSFVMIQYNMFLSFFFSFLESCYKHLHVMLLIKIPAVYNTGCPIHYQLQALC
jgi:hypothetical protein